MNNPVYRYGTGFPEIPPAVVAYAVSFPEPFSPGPINTGPLPQPLTEQLMREILGKLDELIRLAKVAK